jgi:hypothetical protein
MEIFIAILFWVLAGLPGYALVLGDIQRDEWDFIGHEVTDIIIAAMFLLMGPIGSLLSLTGYEGKPLRLIPKQFDWRR